MRATESIAAVTIGGSQDSTAVILAEPTNLRLCVWVVVVDKFEMDLFKMAWMKDWKWVFLKE
jgi:hypothetical protein